MFYFLLGVIVGALAFKLYRVNKFQKYRRAILEEALYELREVERSNEKKD
ncbi:MAG: hypothetical protein HQL36_02640 [Alphaproteobacteria bacterium]|nr:hypothetical protein [Alphaproteobacteria bacterium]MBF0250894.1 hypothetical protein [Alphaproteobacteria bacterium]